MHTSKLCSQRSLTSLLVYRRIESRVHVYITDRHTHWSRPTGWTLYCATCVYIWDDYMWLFAHTHALVEHFHQPVLVAGKTTTYYGWYGNNRALSVISRRIISYSWWSLLHPSWWHESPAKTNQCVFVCRFGGQMRSHYSYIQVTCNSECELSGQ